MRKEWLAGAAVLAMSLQAHAGDGKGLLDTIGRALGNTPKTAAQAARSPYLDPAGTYWDLDQEETEGALHLRLGATVTGSQGATTCDGYLVAQAHSGYVIQEQLRRRCLANERTIATKIHGKDGLEASDHAGIERRYGPAFDARAARIKAMNRYAVRPNYRARGNPTFNPQRGTLDIYAALPWIEGPSPDAFSGYGFVPGVARKGGAVYTPKNGGDYFVPVAMAVEDAQAHERAGRDPADDVVVFQVKRGWIQNGFPRAELHVEKVRVGYRDRNVTVTLPPRDASQAGQ